MSFDKEKARLQFAAFTNKYTLVPFDQVGMIQYRGKDVDFKTAFSDLAERFKTSDISQSPDVLAEAYEAFRSAMKPIAKKKFFGQNDANPIGYIYLYFMGEVLHFDGGIQLSSQPTSLENNNICFLDFKKFIEMTSQKDIDERAWTVEDICCVLLGKPLKKTVVAKKVEEKKVNSSNKEVPSWLIPRAASKMKLKPAPMPHSSA